MTALFPDGLKGAIFDCDGVMIDSTDANRAFYNLILEHYGLPPMRPDQEEYCFMATAAEALLSLLPESLHSELPRMGRDVVNYRTRIMPLVRLFPGFLDFAETLRSAGVRMAVLTNRTDSGIKAVLDFFSLPPYFDPVLSASCGHPKPRPEGALMILDAWGLRPSEVLYVGDSDADRLTALAAGIPFAALTPGRRLAGDIRCESYEALASALEGALPGGAPRPRGASSSASA